jgi:hemerythrin-like domain-containing protein
MDTVQRLSEDHRLIERLLTCLETAAARLRAGEAVRPEIFLTAGEFVRHFADGCHHRKEEEALFPALEAAGVPRYAGPIGVMLSEHDDGRRYTSAMCAGAEMLAAGNRTATAEVARSAEAYTALMRQHIYKEDNVLFQIARRILQAQQQAALAQAFDEIEADAAGAYARYEALVQALEQELACGSAAAARAA